MKSNRQFTIRELMSVVLFAAVGIAGLTTGGVVASAIVGLAIVATTCFAIVAFVGREQLRSFAIGFVIPVIAYAATVLSIGITELDPYAGKLPTTQLLRPAFQLIVRKSWVNMFTGQPVPNYNPATAPSSGGGGFGGTPPIGLVETPDRTTFMSLAHAILAMIFGYAGAKFALWIHRRQSPEPKS